MKKQKLRPEDSVDFAIRWAWHLIARMYNTEAAMYNSTMATGYVLLNIDTEEGTPSTKLGPKMGMESRSLTRILKTLEDKKLISRQPDKNDKRVVRIFLTKLGKEKREIAKETVLKFNYYIRKKIPAKKLHTFFNVINQIGEIIEYEPIYN